MSSLVGRPIGIASTLVAVRAETRGCATHCQQPFGCEALAKPPWENDHRCAPGEMLGKARASFDRPSVESYLSVSMPDVAQAAGLHGASCMDQTVNDR